MPQNIKNTQALTMKDLPKEERPYERLEKYGAGALSDAELLAIIIRSGAQGRKAIDTAYALLNIDERYPGLEGLVRLRADSLKKISGIGRVKAIQIEAVCELAGGISRIPFSRGQILESPSKAASYYMTSMRGLTQEELHIMMLDTGGALIGEQRLTVGTVNASLIDPRDIFICALRGGAVSIILVHNHPSGSLTPSRQDIESTRRVCEAGKLLGIELFDHLIIGNMNYLSLREAGYI